MQIPIGRTGFVATIDDEDAGRIGQYKCWELVRTKRAGVFYACARQKKGGVRGATIYMHRLVMSYAGPLDVDHINGDGLDNRKSNLRIATRSQNLANNRGRGAVSGFKGVRAHKDGRHWSAQIGVNGKNKYLGWFTSPTAAASAYDSAAREAFGEFAVTNFSEVQ